MASDNADLEQSFTLAVLDDFAEKTRSDCSLVLEPLGDGIGWRATAVTSTELVLGRASATTALAAVDLAVSRALDNLAQALAEADDDEADDRERP